MCYHTHLQQASVRCNRRRWQQRTSGERRDRGDEPRSQGQSAPCRSRGRTDARAAKRRQAPAAQTTASTLRDDGLAKSPLHAQVSPRVKVPQMTTGIVWCVV